MFNEEKAKIDPQLIWVDWSLKRRKQLRENIQDASETLKIETAKIINLNNILV
ncbi:MAG: hypothetical protein GF311_22835 [Candidatus Lokiarchaeota archaeon]|nr:hypothetical protein [Candidatus Lokiarchaeota archaeon]